MKKSKAIDCVEMKRRIQAQLLAEYEAQPGKYASFSAFIRAKAAASPWSRTARRRCRRPDASTR